MNLPLPRRAPVTLPTSIRDSAYARGLAYTFAAGIAFGMLGPLSNLAYRAGMGSATFAALRASVGALLLGALLLWGRSTTVRFRDLSVRDRVLLGITALAQASLSLSLFAAYGQMSVALVLAVYFSYPVLVAGASIALGRERLTGVRAAALVIAIGGLTLVVLGHAGPETRPSLVGLALAGFAATCQATYLVVSRNSFTRVPSEQATAIILASAALIAWAVALPVDGVSGRLLAWVGDPSAWIALLLAGSLGAGIAKVWMLRGVRRIGGTRAAVVMLVEPVVGVVLAAVLLGQVIGTPEVVGGIGVLAGAALAQRPARAR